MSTAAAQHAETLRRAQAICAEAEARAEGAERRAGRLEAEAADARAEARRLEKELKASAHGVAGPACRRAHET